MAATTAVAPTPSAATACSVDTPQGDFANQVKMSPGHARVWRLYQAFFLRQPDEGGFDYWGRVRSEGAELSAIAYEFADSPEFRGRYGNLTNRQFVELIYTNVLCRPAEAEGLDYWTAELDSGRLTRWDMMIYFVELEEYLNKTQTCHSSIAGQGEGVSACDETRRRPLSQANWSDDGYQSYDQTVTRVDNRGTGSFRAVKVDFSRGVFSAGHDRCSVASINANWLVASEKDRFNPGVLGLGIVDGRPVKNSGDRTDRGIFGLRFDNDPEAIIEVWPGDTLSDDDTRLNSIMYRQGRVVLEQWYAAAESSPLMDGRHVDPKDWVWAAAGVPIIIDGQTDKDLAADVARDPYTYSTLRHSFVAFDQNSGKLVFGATSNLDVRDLESWFRNNGFEDLIKFDGGASAEFNIGGQAVVAGTSRDVPVWLGIGC